MTRALLEVVRMEIAHCHYFRQLSSRCRGAWPVSILDCLEMLASEAGPWKEAAIRLSDDAQEGDPDVLSPVEGFPIEHPLDSDWRFAPGVPEMILRKLRSITGEDGRIILACVPTLVVAAARLQMSHQVVVPVRNGDPVSKALRELAPEVRYVDFEELDGLDASAGIIDPPWYDDVASPLVQRTCAGIRERGTLLICGPDELTAASSAQVLSGGAAGLYPGLVATGRISRIRYRTPHFELRALQAAGIKSVPAFWRTGLLRPLVRSGTSDAAIQPLARNDAWVEAPFRVGRIWLRPSAALGGNARIVVADSVSRTSPLRSVASAWTSSNTVVIGGSVNEIQNLALGLTGPASDLVLKLEETDAKACWRRRTSHPAQLAPPGNGWDNFDRPRESGFPAV